MVEGADQFVAWNQDIIDRTIADLDGTLLRHRRAVSPMPVDADPRRWSGGTPTTHRRARTSAGRARSGTRSPARPTSHCGTRSTIAYHESTPGHHLQLAQTMYQAESLTRFQRLAVFISGHGEGWALYAERLMHELGYFDDPVYELGCLVAQALRAAR